MSSGLDTIPLRSEAEARRDLILPVIRDAKIPTPDQLRRVRESMGLSQAELAAALGFGKTGEHVIRQWEQRADHYRPTPLAWNCLRRTAGILHACNGALPYALQQLLPEVMR